MDIRVLVVPADEEQAPFVKELEDYDYQAGQAIVGGYIQPIELHTMKATVWGNEEGLLIGLPLNTRATRYLYTFAPEHEGRNVLVGDVYLTGQADQHGNTLSVPQEVIDHFTLIYEQKL